MLDDLNDLITISEACKILGGTKPIHRSTYYRHAATGRFPRPVHPSPGISRLVKREVIDARDRLIGGNTRV